MEPGLRARVRRAPIGYRAVRAQDRPTDSYDAAVLRAADLGDDADTTAAVCGQLAGAFYGASGIPDRWLMKLVKRDHIVTLAEQLWEAAAARSAGSIKPSAWRDTV